MDLLSLLTLENMIILAGIAHFGILLASVQVPTFLDWKNELAKLSPMNRSMMWTYGIFIAMTIVSLGLISVFNADALADQSPLARWISGFIFVFWLARLVVQFFVFDVKPYLRNRLDLIGYHGLTVVFVFITVVFGWAAFSR